MVEEFNPLHAVEFERTVDVGEDFVLESENAWIILRDALQLGQAGYAALGRHLIEAGADLQTGYAGLA